MSVRKNKNFNRGPMPPLLKKDQSPNLLHYLLEKVKGLYQKNNYLKI